MTSAPVVVGIDGSEDALLAAAWAAQEAARRDAPLQVLYANMWPLIRGHWPADFADRLLLQSERLVQEAVRHARKSSSVGVVSGTVITGHAVPVLVERSRSAQLMVVGSRGLGGFTGMLLGSTAATLAARAACPIVVVRVLADDRPRAPVVVGIASAQASPGDLESLRFAFRAAAASGTSIRVLHAVRDASARLPWADPDVDSRIDDMLQEARDHVEKAISGLCAEFAEVPVEVNVRLARPAAALVELSGEAQLVVVGSRGRGGMTGLLMGSVSQALLHHARCPVAVIRADTPAPASSG